MSRTIALTTLAMLAFAANSLLCRLALLQGRIDAATFGSVRLLAGALALALILRWRAGPAPAAGGSDWRAAVALFAYVAFFSFAYLSLSAGTGALILFGAVQLTMFGAGLRAGERFQPLAWAGFAAAVAGLLYLVAPGVTAPPLLGATSMALAGVAWGIYSLRGRGVADPLRATAGNFARATPLMLVLSLAMAGQARADAAGVGLAVASGAIASGMGYVIWYAALRGLSALRAATVQLSVPVIAAFGGVLFLAESISWRLALASAAILGGIALVLASRAR
ncbi:MAG TPA: DMT family transporter [Ideonella sp.]|nr:DMT family transporter [Ideonella sp.]